MFSVIFDMDGTLLNTQKICIPAWEYAGNLQGIKGMGEHIYKICGMNETGWTAYLSNNFPSLDISKFKQDARAYIIENGKVKFKKGAKKLLDYFKSRGIKMAIASGSSMQSINHHLNEVHAAKYFDAIVGSHDVLNGKPAPDVFLLAAKKLCVNPSDCFVFEDSANGIKAAYAAGMKCIGVPDLVDFEGEIAELLFRKLSSLDEAIELFQNIVD